MEKLKANKTELFNLCGFFVEIVETNADFEVWIQKHGYGVKSFVFGVPKKQQTYDEFLEIVEINLLNENYFDDYESEYCD